jgi:ATP-dependent DNA helicase RecG
MNYQELVELLRGENESQTLEFKESFDAASLGKAIAGFATSGHGRIVIGVKKNKTPVPSKYPEDIEEKILSITSNLNPQLHGLKVERIPTGNGLDLIVVHVPRGFNPPYSSRGAYYCRDGNTTRTLNAEEIVRYKAEAGTYSYDAQPASTNGRAATMADIDEFAVARFAKMLQEGRGINANFQNAHQVLSNLDLLQMGFQPLNAAVMMFGKEPQLFVPGCSLSLDSYSGSDTSSSYNDRLRIEGDLLTLLRVAEAFIRRNIRHASKIEAFERKDADEYPLEALREAVVNAVAHKDYTVPSDIAVKIFRDRIEITNPGGLPFKGLTKEDLMNGGGRSVRRNPKIADLLLSANSMEKAGTGIPRMRALMQNHGLPQPEFNVTENWFQVIFRGPGENLFSVVKNVRTGDLKGLNQRQFKAVEFLTQSPQSTLANSSYRELTGATYPMAARDLSGLVDRKLVRRIGQGRGTRYVPT